MVGQLYPLLVGVRGLYMSIYIYVYICIYRVRRVLYMFCTGCVCIYKGVCICYIVIHIYIYTNMYICKGYKLIGATKGLPLKASRSLGGVIVIYTRICI